jgi:hypothetical protein
MHYCEGQPEVPNIGGAEITHEDSSYHKHVSRSIQDLDRTHMRTVGVDERLLKNRS